MGTDTQNGTGLKLDFLYFFFLFLYFLIRYTIPQINQNIIMNKPVNPMPSLNHLGYSAGQISNKKQLIKTNANKIYIITFRIFCFVHQLISSPPWVYYSIEAAEGQDISDILCYRTERYFHFVKVILKPAVSVILYSPPKLAKRISLGLLSKYHCKAI